MEMKNQQMDRPELNIRENSPIIVGLDIGTTKTVIMAAQKTIDDKIEIIGFGRSDADRGAVRGGEVINIHDTVLSIQKALEACDTHCQENNLDLKIEEVYVGISGKHIKTTRTQDKMIRKNPNTTITKEEVLQFIESQYKVYVPNNTKIIDVIPENFEVDQKPVKKVEGTCGVYLGAIFHIITADEDAMKMINLSVSHAGLKTVDLVLQPLASTTAVLSQYEMETNVAIVDIGGGTTDITVLHEGEVHHTAVIPLGGTDFTNDIHRGLRLPLYKQAEEIKKRYGCVLPEMVKANKFITIPAFKSFPAKEIEIKKLAEIMQARALDILENIYRELNSVGLSDGSLDSVILTGGGSQLRYLKDLAAYKLGVQVHLGIPDEHLAPGHIEQFKNPAYATCIGLLLKGFEDYDRKNITTPHAHLVSPQESTHTVEVKSNKVSNSHVEPAPVKKSFFLFNDKLNQLKKGILKTFGDEDISNKSF